MTKLMDELVEIGAEALCGTGWEGAEGSTPEEDESLKLNAKEDAQTVLNAVLPILAQRMMKPTPHMVREGSATQVTAITIAAGDGPPLSFQATETDIWQAMLLEFCKHELNMIGELK
jgi:hypothetical protein